MKKLFLILALVSLTFFGCQQQDSPLEPEINDNTETLAKRNDTGWDSFFSSLNLSTSFTKDGFSMYSKSYTIDGEKGGVIRESNYWVNYNGRRVNMSATLTIPAGAFEGKLTFDIIFDIENLAVELSPSPFTFDIPVELDLKFSNVDLSGVDPDNFDFVYLNPDGTTESVEYESITINKDWDYLYVKKAKLKHFSRYGWTR